MFRKRRLSVLAAIIMALALSAVIGCASPTPPPAPTTQAPAQTTPALSPTAAFKPMTLSYANPLAATGPQQWTETMKPWSEEIARRTNGAVTIKPYHDGSLLGNTEMAQGLKIGTANLGNLQTGYYNSLMPAHTLDSVPLISGPNPYANVLIERIVWSEFPVFNEEFERENVVNLFVGATAPQIYIVKKPVKTLADLSGLRVRALGIYYPRMVQPVGMVPVSMSFADVYEALQRGVLDGGITAAVFIRQGQWDKVAKQLVTPGAIPALAAGIAFVVNKDTWKELPQEVRKIMLEEGKKREALFGKYMVDQDQVSIDASIKEENCALTVLTEAEMQEWTSKVPDFLAEYANDVEARGIPGKEIVERVRELNKLSDAELEKLWEEAWNREMARLLAM
ncbi:MAG: TRAP transporter substrate-binding protein DctP [Chloroflexi bacterium]|nr:TRAP transporter substrate-binding protein DctP [Chloroflexota bacterium]